MPFKSGEPNPGRPFQPGQSGNPCGVPAAQRDVTADFRALAKGSGYEALGRIIKRALYSDDEAMRNRCDEFLVSYGFSRPPQEAILNAGTGWGVINYGFPAARIGRADADIELEANPEPGGGDEG